MGELHDHVKVERAKSVLSSAGTGHQAALTAKCQALQQQVYELQRQLAEKTLENRIPRQAMDVALHRMLGERGGEDAIIREELDAIIREELDMALFHRHASGSLAAVGRIDEAIADGEKASDLAPRNPEFALHVGTLLSNAGRHAEAAQYLDRAVALEPTFDPSGQSSTRRR